MSNNKQSSVEQHDEFDFNLGVVEFVATELEKNNIPVLRTEEGNADIGPGLYNGEDGFYFRHPSIYLSYDEQAVSRLFPMGVGPYTVWLKNVTPIEVEDDRLWPSSIGFVVRYEDD